MAGKNTSGAPSAAQIKKDVAEIKKLIKHEPEDEEYVHLPDSSDEEYVKVYQYLKNEWKFIKRITKQEAEAELDDSDEDDAESDEETETDAKNNKAVKPEAVKNNVEKKPVVSDDEVKPKKTRKSKKNFTLTDLQEMIDNDQDKAKEMVQALIDKFGDDLMSKRGRGAKKEKDPSKPKSEYHQFMADKLGEMKGNKDIPVKERMQKVSEMWKQHKAAQAK